jgi:hypothetical protein
MYSFYNNSVKVLVCGNNGEKEEVHTAGKFVQCKCGATVIQEILYN